MTSTQTHIDYRALAEGLIEGYTDSKAIVANGPKMMRVNDFDVPQIDGLHTKLRETVAELLRAGEPVPYDIGREVFEAQQLVRTGMRQEGNQPWAPLLAIRENAIDGVVNGAKQDLAALSGDDLEPAFRRLDLELTSIVDDATDVLPAVKGSLDATEVLAENDSAAINAWRRLSSLADSYDSLRAVQVDLLQPLLGSNDGLRERYNHVYTVGLYRNAIDVSDAFLERRHGNGSIRTVPTTAFQKDIDTGHRQWMLTSPAKLGLNTNDSWWPSGVEKTAAFIRIITIARPWVPTLTQFLSARTFAMKATEPINGTDTQQAIALASYRKLVGDEDDE